MDLRQIYGAIICAIPSDTAVDMDEINKIVHATSNTWQRGRGIVEKTANTIMGKKAEAVLEHFLAQQCQLTYLSYDKFRTDNFKKHAPFDGLIFSPTTNAQIVETCIKDITEEIARGPQYGKISPQLRRKLEDSGIFTIEVKSSNLKNHDFDGVSLVIPRNDDDRLQIIKNIERWDFFIYPHFLRNTETISTFYEYAEYVRANVPEYKGLSNSRALSKLMKTEFENASDIYTRLYFDSAANEIYIPGYILKQDFFVRPRVGKMPGTKSGKALYYMHGIVNRQSFWRIDHDSRIWNFNYFDACKNLFACSAITCPNCGDSMAICKNAYAKKYFYRCYNCSHSQNI